MQKILILGLLMMATASNRVLTAEPTKNLDTEIMEAQVYLASGDTAGARSRAEALISKFPKHEQAQALMAEVIDREIAQDKEVAKVQAPEEMDPKEKRLEIERWLERAKTLMAYQQYEQAVLAAEKVFQFDAENLQASRLIDEAQGKALKEGRGAMDAVKKFAQGEAKDREGGYLQQARLWMKTGRIGAARLACDKILLLDPTHSEALDIKNQIRKRLQDEAGKTI